MVAGVTVPASSAAAYTNGLNADPGWRPEPPPPTADGCPTSGYLRLVNVSTVTQLNNALANAQPGDQIRLNAYAQRQPLRTIAGGMPIATVDLGDRPAPEHDEGWIGPYVGETLGRARSIVHFDPLVAAARNRPTAVAITACFSSDKAS